MNRKMIFYTVGHIALADAALLLLPALVALIYLEKSGFSFLISAALALCLGMLLVIFAKPDDRLIRLP